MRGILCPAVQIVNINNTMQKMRWRTLVFNLIASLIVLFLMSGCSALQETMTSQLEVPTLENQANRIAIGMTIIRENAIIENLEISSDATWPAMLCAEIDETKIRFLDEAVMNDPYHATAHYTKAIQRKMLGSGSLVSQFGDAGDLAAMVIEPKVSPLTYKALHKLDILFSNPDLKPREAYGTQEEYINARTQNWPNIFSFKSSSDFIAFENGRLASIESPQGDIYKNMNKAVLALAPVNLAKDLELSQDEYEDGLEEVKSLKAELGDLNKEEKSILQNEIAVKEEEIKAAESIADEKELIYFTKLDQMLIEIESSVDTDDQNYMNLAKNVNITAKEIQSSSNEAYVAFTLALSNIIANDSLQKFPTELKSLVLGAVFIPANLRSKYNARLERIAQNSVLLLPSVFVGTYYAAKQASRAAKYEEITEKILEIFNVKMQQDAAVKAAQK